MKFWPSRKVRKDRHFKGHKGKSDKIALARLKKDIKRHKPGGLAWGLYKIILFRSKK